MRFPRADWLDQVVEDPAVPLRGIGLAASLIGHVDAGGTVSMGYRLLMAEARIGSDRTLTAMLTVLERRGHLVAEPLRRGQRGRYHLLYEGEEVSRSGTAVGEEVSHFASSLSTALDESVSTETEGLSPENGATRGQSVVVSAGTYSERSRPLLEGLSPNSAIDEGQDPLYRAPTDVGPVVCPECGIGGRKHLEDCSRRKGAQ